MGLVGVCGYSYIAGSGPALKLIGQTSMRTVTSYQFGVIPMFLLMGAFVSAMLACGFDSVEMAHIAHETFVARNYLNDYTLPKVSLIRGERFHARLAAIFGARRIEELRRSYYCISTNLTTGLPMVISLKRLRSDEMCQGRPPSRPITPLRDTATT